MEKGNSMSKEGKNKSDNSEGSKSKSKWGYKKIGALWQKTSQNGKKMLTGVLDIDGKEIRVVCFKNTDKEKETSPDVLIYIDDYKPEPKNKNKDNDFFDEDSSETKVKSKTKDSAENTSEDHSGENQNPETDF